MNVAPSAIEEMRNSWRPGAMFPSEIMWLYEHIISHRVQVVLECGRQDGVSTRALGALLFNCDVDIVSIDFDENKQLYNQVKASLAGLRVECVSGDIHLEVPRLLQQFSGRRIAVVQDGPKGWEGLSTLLACAFNPDVVLLAQHNLHVGHKSRSFFGFLTCNPCFLEYDPHAKSVNELRQAEQSDPRFLAGNRQVDHSSLGICSLQGVLRDGVLENLREAGRLMGPWSAHQTSLAWNRGDYGHVSRLRRHQPFSWYRFKLR